MSFLLLSDDCFSILFDSLFKISSLKSFLSQVLRKSEGMALGLQTCAKLIYVFLRKLV